MSSTSEQRIFQRRPCALDLEMTTSDWTELEEVQAVDLSLIGVGLRASNPFRVLSAGAPIELHSTGSSPVMGVVRWSRDNRSGVQFTHQWDEVLGSWVGETLAELRETQAQEPTPQTHQRPVVQTGSDCDVTLYN